MKKVFLGGTCNNSTWRDEIIPKLKIDYFNPVVEDWTPECQEEEIRQRQICDYLLYVITSEMKGVYSIAEVIDDSNKEPNKTIFCFIGDKFDESQIKSLKSVAKMIEEKGANFFDNLDGVVDYLNSNSNNNIKYIDINEFRTKGYLQELNRQFLHPLGLALEVKIENDKETLGGIWDYRNDAEGIYYDIKNSDEQRKSKFKQNEKFIKEEFKKRKKIRQNKLGFDIEPI
ncbi:nucleoside 2-deoxyribosyltransferase domain-containing protein [Candidatus Dojkabacteria bacterium]|jgi:hypothetical protein|nr:nucleoside 2-deoxyribosyltransferase domain-containing protein [Candidatus Dojkabacteria bacterium]